MLLVCLSVQSMSSPSSPSEAEREFKEEVIQLILDKELIIEREDRKIRVSRPERVSRLARMVRPQREVSFGSSTNVKSKPIALKTLNKKTKISLSLNH